MTLGKRLKRLRGKRTQEDISDALGISRARYSHYENDHVQPDHELLIKMANYYNVSLDFLLSGVESKAKESTIALPESEYMRIVKELEEEYSVSLHDDPIVLEAVRSMIEILAKQKQSR